MIKADDDGVKIKGPYEDIVGEFCAIVYTLAGEINKIRLRRYFELGLKMSGQDIDALNIISNAFKDILEVKNDAIRD